MIKLRVLRRGHYTGYLAGSYIISYNLIGERQVWAFQDVIKKAEVREERESYAMVYREGEKGHALRSLGVF